MTHNLMYINTAAVPESIEGLDFNLKCSVIECENTAFYSIARHGCDLYFGCMAHTIAYQSDALYKITVHGAVRCADGCGKYFADIDEYMDVRTLI